MAWLYVPGLEDLSEELNQSFLDQEPFAMSKGKPIQLRSWRLRWKRDHFLKHLSGLMCEPSMANRGVARFLSSLEDSHVNPIQKRGNNWPIRIHEICGRTLPAPLARLDHTSSSWKTSQMSLSGHYPHFSKTFPKWGMMRRGVLWQLPKLAHPTNDPVGSYLPTPTTQANMLCDSMSHSKAHRNLNQLIWPTPTVNHIRNHNEPVKNYEKRVQDWKEGKTKGKPGISLGVAVRKFATPTVTDAANMPMRKVAKESLAKGNWRGIDLRTSAQLIPSKIPFQNTGKLNPQWVEWLMGWPIGFTECEHVGTE